MNKISKILLPLGTLITTTATVTPLISCGSDGVDLLNYSPDQKTLHKAEALTADQATEALFGGEKSQAINLVKQDILTYLSWELGNEIDLALILAGVDWVGHVRQATAKLTNLDLEYDDNAHKAYLSGKIELKAVCSMISPVDHTQHIGIYTLETYHDIKKLPYHMVYTKPLETVDWTYWTSYFDQNELKSDKNWTVDFGYHAESQYFSDYREDPVDESFACRFDNIDDAKFQALTLVRWWSYHLINVTKA